MSQLGIGKKVRKLRERKAWTQEHLAKAADVSLRTVQRAEDGVMSAETLSALAGALDLPVEQLSYDESGYPAVTPFLFYANGETFDWLVTAFGFTVRMKHQGPGGVVVHGELGHNSGVIMIGAATQENPTPQMAGVRTQSLYLMVDDADAHCAAARAAGAKIVGEPESAHGHRRYTAEDPEGHRWMFASVLD